MVLAGVALVAPVLTRREMNLTHVYGVFMRLHGLDVVDAAVRAPTRLVRESLSFRDGAVPTQASISIFRARVLGEGRARLPEDGRRRRGSRLHYHRKL